MYFMLSMIALALVALIQTAFSPSTPTVEGYDDEESHRQTNADAQDDMRRRREHDHDVFLAHLNSWDDSDRHRHD